MEEKEKKIKIDKKKVTICTLIGLVIITSILIIFFVINKNIEQDIIMSVNTFTTSFKTGDNEQAKIYVTDETVSFLTFEEIPENTELMNIFLEYLSCEVVDISRKKDQAIVKVNFSNKEIGKIMEIYMQKVIEISIANENTEVPEEQIQKEQFEFLKQQFDSQDNEIVTNEVEFKLEKVDGIWKIIVDDNFRNGMFPGLAKVVESMGPQNPH